MRQTLKYWLDFLIVIYFAVAVVIGALIARNVFAGAAADLETLRRDAQRNAEATAAALGREIVNFQHLAALFVREKGDFLKTVLASPDPDALIFELDDLAGKWFPTALAFTLTDAEGIPVISDFKGGIGPACLADMRRSARGELKHVPLHGIGTIPHIDILVPVDSSGSAGGNFMVSFTTASFATALTIPADLPYQIRFVARHDAAGDDGFDFPAASSDMVVRGMVNPDYAADIDRNARNAVMRYVGFLAAFTLLGAFVIWRARVRILADDVALRKANDELEALALTDPLTGLNNRRALTQLAATLFAQASREQKTVSLALIDIDHFKRINDMLGHDVGDACLMAVGQAIARAAQRPLDCALRFGGEEFLVCWYGTDAAAATSLATAIAATIRALPRKHADGTALTISAGIVSRPPECDESLESLLKRADDALYRAKAAGRDRIELA